MIAASLKLCEIVVWLGVHMISHVEGVQIIETQRETPSRCGSLVQLSEMLADSSRGSSADES
jgi:hypothetical protein